MSTAETNNVSTRDVSNSDGATSDAGSKEDFKSRFRYWLIAAAMFCGLAFAGYQTLFSSFATYDDEGYVMIALQSHIDGNALYDTTFSQYGPAYFQLNGWLHRLLDIPVTHDIVRFKTLITWLLVAGLAGLVVFRITRSRWIALAATPMLFLHLDRLGLEPAHPQELCLLLLLGCLYLATQLQFQKTKATGTSCNEIKENSNTGNTNGGHHRFLIAIGAIGLLVAVLLMIKVNLGVFLILSFGLTLTAKSSSSKLIRGLYYAAIVLTTIMPLVLMRKHFGSLEGAMLPLIIVGSTLIATIFTAKSVWNLEPITNRRILSLVVFVASILIGIVGMLSIAMMQGTSAAGLLEGIVLQHADLKVFGYARLYAVAIPMIGLSAWCALNVSRNIRSKTTVIKLQRWIDLGIVGILCCVLLRQLTDSFQVMQNGVDDRSLAMILTSLVTPFAWIVLIPLLKNQVIRGGLPNTNESFARLSLCFVAILQPMQAYPIPGTQIGLGSLTLLMILIVGLHDVIGRGLVFQTAASTAQAVAKTRLRITMLAVAATLVVVIIRDVTTFKHRSNCVSLNLPGAVRLRLPVQEQQQVRWVVSELRKNGETFIAAPSGYQSYYFWAGLDAPTSLNATFWPTLLSQDQQEQVRDELENRQRVSALVHTGDDVWKSLETPLTRYLLEEFEPIANREQHEIWGRKGDDSNQLGWSQQ